MTGIRTHDLPASIPERRRLTTDGGQAKGELQALVYHILLRSCRKAGLRVCSRMTEVGGVSHRDKPTGKMQCSKQNFLGHRLTKRSKNKNSHNAASPTSVIRCLNRDSCPLSDGENLWFEAQAPYCSIFGLKHRYHTVVFLV